MKLAGVCVVTQDVIALADWYGRVLQLEPQGDDCHMSFEDSGLALVHADRMEGMAPGSTQVRAHGSIVLMFQVSDVDREWARLQAMGVQPTKPPATHPWGTRSVWFRDPDGNLVDFYCLADLTERTDEDAQLAAGQRALHNDGG